MARSNEETLGPRFFVLGAKAKLAGAPGGPKRAELPLDPQVVDFGP